MALSDSSKKSNQTKISCWTPGRAVLTIAVLGLLIALGVESCNSNDKTNKGVASTNGTSNASKPPAATNPAPAPVAPVPLSQELRDTKVQTLNGQSLKLADYADKVVVVNIWATWCGPCQLEMPELIKMNNEYKSQGLVVLGLATSYNERQGQGYVKDFIRAKGINY